MSGPIGAGIGGSSFKETLGRPLYSEARMGGRIDGPIGPYVGGAHNASPLRRSSHSPNMRIPQP